MIITSISGGLGNQMFQYAIAKSIAKKRNDIFKMDVNFYPKQTLRKYELDFFNLKENFATNEEIEAIKGKVTFFSKLKKRLGYSNNHKSFFQEKALSTFDKDVFEYNDNVYLDGYWQNEKYFIDIKNDIYKDFTLKNEISIEAKRYLYLIQNSKSVSIHIRRGDYIQNVHTNNVHGICAIEYYEQAVSYITKRVDSPYFYIFSDDIAWCKENFNFIENKLYIDETKSAFDDLELMKNCQHNIIANSTFSWWAAWLNENNNCIIICPKNWFANTKMQEESKDILPKAWVKI